MDGTLQTIRMGRACSGGLLAVGRIRAGNRWANQAARGRSPGCSQQRHRQIFDFRQLVADYFALIEADEPIPGTELTPRVRALIGALKGATVTEDDYRCHLEEKYR